MANISITGKCNRACSYCFASPMLRGDDGESAFMTRPEFLRVLRLLRLSRIDQVRLLGGEPTLHPDFRWFVRQALDQGFRLLVFSNGLMPESAARSLQAAPADRASILVNIHSEREQKHGERERLEATLRMLGQHVVPGYNIHTPAPELDFILDLIDRHDLSRCVRLGLAHPSQDGSNLFLRAREYAHAGRKIAEFVRRAADSGVSVEYDCGFVPCMFPDGFWDLPGVRRSALGLSCGPVPDILPDGSMIPCYPLGSEWRAARQGEGLGFIRDRFSQKMRSYRSLGIFSYCRKCPFRLKGLCAGGCLALSIRRLRQVPFVFTTQDSERETHGRSQTGRKCARIIEARNTQ